MTWAKSKRIEESDQLAFLLFAQCHLESLIVEIHQLEQVRRGAVVEIGCARRKAAQNRSLQTIEVGAIAREQRAARIGRVKGFGLTRIEGIRAAGDQEHR